MSALVSSAMPAKRLAWLCRAVDALLDDRRELTRHTGHVEMDVDAIQQRSTDPLLDAVVTAKYQDAAECLELKARTIEVVTINSAELDPAEYERLTALWDAPQVAEFEG